MASDENKASVSSSDTSPPTSTRATGLFSYAQPAAQSKIPALTTSVLFAASALVPPAALGQNVYLPPYLHRVGFSFIFGGVAYVFSTGDHRNGSGIATAWSLTYLFLHLRKSLKTPRHPLTLAMAGGAAGCAALYGTEYFVYED
ncbi:hypothetical protein F5J12DRAFT_269378 [Pisolithus orientalis]|uniref:uncharacterized protein n=1 Tax=Pisolithus orientalis TaxID=936130 RepID=UPI002223FFBB|nr:uncharacterized protein F5J12DRAFT_269378 [Pisolithus orientalis]KAI5999835.1 hypothetical protein F5J12DRAFT_269378 [Pisolithus orientalis]